MILSTDLENIGQFKVPRVYWHTSQVESTELDTNCVSTAPFLETEPSGRIFGGGS